jgi:hypothetical protein
LAFDTNTGVNKTLGRLAKIVWEVLSKFNKASTDKELQTTARTAAVL